VRKGNLLFESASSGTQASAYTNLKGEKGHMIEKKGLTSSL